MDDVDISIIRNMIVDILVKAERPLTANEIVEALTQTYGVNNSQSEVNQILYGELAQYRLVVNGSHEWSMPVARSQQPNPQPQVPPTRPNPPPAPRNAPQPQVVVQPTTQTPSQKPSAATAQVPIPPKTAPAFSVAYIVVVCLISAVIVTVARTPRKARPVPQYSVPYSENRAEARFNKPPPTGDVSVRGYQRSDGTYVKPHYRSPENGMQQDNFSTRGNFNPYTGKPGSK